MKKIGVLTYLKEYANLGTNMQSYCTLKAVQKEFPDDRVELIDYSSWKPLMKPYLTNVSFQSLRNDYIRIKKYRKFFKESLELSNESFISADLKSSIDFIKNQRYDAIYVGSDTLLELKRASKDELTAYWLDNTVDCRKFLIAASSHNVVFEKLSVVQKEKIRDTINDYSLLGVRDEASHRLLSNFIHEGDHRLQMVPDPTFTLKIDSRPIEAYFSKNKLVFDKPVVCLHLLRNTNWAAALARLFKKKGYLVASLRPAYYADIIFTDLSPFEQVGLYKYFDLVITHRFHDSIFSLKNLTPVIVFPEFSGDVTSHGENKNKTLLKAFHIDDVNYIDKKENVNAEYLFDIHELAITNFNSQLDFIKLKLEENCSRYESYVKQTKEMVLQ